MRNCQVGEKIADQYEIQNIKQGGMGFVYLCYDHKLKEPVALKTLQDQYLSSPTLVKRFIWEAETWVRLERHRNIVPAKYVKAIEGKPYIFLEYIVGDEQYGPDLSAWIERKGLDLELSHNFAIQFCTGMHYAQRKFEEMKMPFVHRDIKPGNIMVTQYRVIKITDFGLVKACQGFEKDIEVEIGKGSQGRKRFSFTKIGNIMGTPPYMPPEQWLEEEVDSRADIYSFGCVLYEMLTGKPPFSCDMWSEFKNHHLRIEPKAIPNIPEELNAVVLRCLNKEPGKRYQGFKEVREKLLEIYYALTGEWAKVDEEGDIEEQIASIICKETWDLGNLGNKGLSLYTLGHYKEAIECYNEALRINPNEADVFNNRGAAYYALGQLERAIKDFDEATRLNPRHASAYYSRGIIYYNLGQHEQAIKDYNEAIRLNPRHVDAYSNRGLAYDALGQHERAIKDFDEAIGLNPRHANAYNNQGLAYDALGQHERAIKDFDEATRLNPRFASAYNNRGCAFDAVGQHEQAINDYYEALRN